MTSATPEAGSGVLMRLRRIALALAVTTTVAVALVMADRVWQLAAAAVAMGGFWLVLFRAARARPALLTVPFGVVIAMGLFAVAAENILWIEARLGLRLAQRLTMSERLGAYVNEHAVFRHDFFESYSPDPMFFRRRPGSLHRGFYDADPKAVYETTADEIGYLNGDKGFYGDGRAITAFVTGDSVIQGVGTPSVTDTIRRRSGLRVFNLAAGSYGPAQKAAALAQFGIPRRPEWLVLEFFAGNDINDAIENDVCRAEGLGFRCRFSKHSVRRGLSRHPVYRHLGNFALHESTNPFIVGLRELRSDILTLALANHLGREMKMAADDWRAAWSQGPAQVPTSSSPAAMAQPLGPRYNVHPDQPRHWFELV
jgi:hypothetical protein